MSDAETALQGFFDAFEPTIADEARQAFLFFRDRHPTLNQLVYDNYNALAIGFSSNLKQSGIAFSVTVYPRWVSLFFSRGVELTDPFGLLKGSGKRIRHVVLTDGKAPDHKTILDLVDQALAICEPPPQTEKNGDLIIQSVSPNRRPRRPG